MMARAPHGAKETVWGVDRLPIGLGAAARLRNRRKKRLYMRRRRLRRGVTNGAKNPASRGGPDGLDRARHKLGPPGVGAKPRGNGSVKAYGHPT